MKTLAVITAVVLTLCGSSLAAGVWSWVLPDAHGTASGKLGAVSALQVSLDGFSDVWPGESIKVTGKVTNPNTRAVTITKTTLDGVEADAGCAKGSYEDTSSGTALPPGDSTVTLGTYTVGRIPVSCAGSSVKLQIALRSAWGAGT